MAEKTYKGIADVAAVLVRMRKAKGYSRTHVIVRTEIDILNKYETGKRLPTRKHLGILCKFYSHDMAEVLEYWYTERIFRLLLKDESYPMEKFEGVIEAVQMNLVENYRLLRNRIKYEGRKQNKKANK